jgi:hypothetical protein
MTDPAHPPAVTHWITPAATGRPASAAAVRAAEEN